MRIVVAALAVLALSACNWVATKTPLFGPADEAGALQLRSGVWVAFASDNCTFDERRPTSDWPDCAGWLVIKNGRWMFAEKKNGRTALTAARVVLTSGSPQILQTPPEATGKGTEAAYSYYGLAATSRDKRGRITAFKLWPVLCGPPAGKDAAGQERPVHPFPGMTMDAGDSDCSTGSRQAVRDAADASRLWADATPFAHWIRDGER